MKPCGDCRFMHPMPIGAGVHECRGPSPRHWVWPDEREFMTRTGEPIPQCEYHDEVASLQGAIEMLKHALQHNAMAVRIDSGTLIGRILPEGFVYDPRYVTPESPKKPRKRKVKT